MPNFRRFYVPDAIVFITGVTRRRRPYLQHRADLDIFWETMRAVKEIHPFRLLAYVILPDHFHWLMRAEDDAGDFSTVLHSVKRNCTLNYKAAHGIAESFRLWQGRFWDHVIRDERDLWVHFDYVHWNPVKHGYVTYPEAWDQSTYVHWKKLGYYEDGWGHAEAPTSVKGMEAE